MRVSMDGRSQAKDNIWIKRFWKTIKYEVYLHPTVVAYCYSSRMSKFPYMANIIDKGQITLQDGSVMSWNITDDQVLTISGALWDGSVTVGKDIKSEARFRHLVLDESVQAIGIFNFSDWDQLEEVTLPTSIKCIEHAAFSGCRNLKRVNLSEGLEIIGADSFSDCKSLETINFPGTLKEILEYAFTGCCSLHDISLPAGVSLGINAFDDDLAFV
jgi:hypothetical protein